MWTNYHTHSNFCDGKETIHQNAQTAVNKGMMSIGFSSHAPLPFDCKWCMRPESLGDYLAAIESARRVFPQIEIYKGLEVDFIPKRISPAQFKQELDYTIGSIHFVESFSNGTGWEIDGPHEQFMQGLFEIFANDIRAAFRRYMELTREMIATAQPTILGHLDKIKIQNIDHKLYRDDESWYHSEIEDTLDVVAANETILEVNTRGIYQKKTTETYPATWILKLAHQKGIRITLSSDAHHADDLTNHFDGAAKMLRDAGFRTIMALQSGRWQSFHFNEHGIIQ